MIDLHTHSTFSDGTYTPKQLIQEAAQSDITLIALTDHDCVTGIPDFQKEAANYPNLTAINGSELAADHPKAEIEIIALDIHHLTPFQQRETALLQKRYDNTHKRAEILTRLGMKMSFEDIAVDENGQVRPLIAKPHVVAALLKKGYIQSREEGFALLCENGAAYIAKKDPDLKETMTLIKENGAVAVLAHPVHTKVTGQELYALVETLKKMGLDGIEVFHSDHSPEQMTSYFEIAQQLGLLVSGGSDFHGKNKPDIHLGSGKGNLNTPSFIANTLLERQKQNKTYYNAVLKCIEQQKLHTR